MVACVTPVTKHYQSPSLLACWTDVIIVLIVLILRIPTWPTGFAHLLPTLFVSPTPISVHFVESREQLVLCQIASQVPPLEEAIFPIG